MKEEHWTALAPLLEGAVQSSMRKYHKYVEREDVRQELILWALQHPGTVRDWLNEGEDQALVRALGNEAHRYGQHEKAAKLGYEYGDLFFWQRAAIEDALPALWDDEGRIYPTPFDDSNTTHGRRDPSEGGNWQASLADIGRAFHSLAIDQQVLLILYYRDGLTQQDIADDYGVSHQTISKRIQKAVKKMHHNLGGSKPRDHRDDCECTGTRRVMSNAAAVAMTEGQEDG